MCTLLSSLFLPEWKGNNLSICRLPQVQRRHMLPKALPHGLTIVLLTFFACLAPRPLVAAGTSFSGAPFMSPSQFLSEVKAVSLTFEPNRSAETYLSGAEQRTYIETALVRYGIAVRPNAPVSLLVTFEHRPSTLRSTTVYSRGSENKDMQLHDIIVTMQFFVRAAALRNGTFHVLLVAPATAAYSLDWTRPQDVSVAKEFKENFANSLTECLKQIASDTKGETAPWPVASWSEKDKATADADFEKLMHSHPAIEKRQFEGLNVLPELKLSQAENNGEVCVWVMATLSWHCGKSKTPPRSEPCVKDSLWRESWNRSFQRLGWVDTHGQAAVSLTHTFGCYRKHAMLDYVWLWDFVSLNERNVVFELNGRLVRMDVTIFSTNRMAIALEAQIKSTLQDYLPRSILDSLTQIVLGNPQVPVIAVPGD